MRREPPGLVTAMAEGTGWPEMELLEATEHVEGCEFACGNRVIADGGPLFLGMAKFAGRLWRLS